MLKTSIVALVFTDRVSIYRRGSFLSEILACQCAEYSSTTNAVLGQLEMSRGDLEFHRFDFDLESSPSTILKALNEIEADALRLSDMANNPEQAPDDNQE